MTPAAPARRLLPLSDAHLDRIERLEKAVGGLYGGWGRDAEGTFFVDVGERRFLGGSLNAALGEALRAYGVPRG